MALMGDVGEVSSDAVHSPKPRLTSSSLARRSQVMHSHGSYHHTKGKATRTREGPFPAMPGHFLAVLAPGALYGHGLKSSGFLQGLIKSGQAGPGTNNP